MCLYHFKSGKWDVKTPKHLFNNELNPNKTVYSTQNKILYQNIIIYTR